MQRHPRGEDMLNDSELIKTYHFVKNLILLTGLAHVVSPQKTIGPLGHFFAAGGNASLQL